MRVRIFVQLVLAANAAGSDYSVGVESIGFVKARKLVQGAARVCGKGTQLLTKKIIWLSRVGQLVGYFCRNFVAPLSPLCRAFVAQ